MERANGDEDLPKVERVATKYGLTGHGDRLVEYWLGDGVDRKSTRELATWFGREVLRAAVSDAGMSVRSGEVENLYRLLTDDEASRGNRTQTELELERAGVDVGELRRDFVSHQTVHTYLTDVRGVERDDAGPDVATVHSRIQRLAGRLRAVTKSGLASLDRAGLLSLGSVSVTVRITVYCSDCGRQFDLTDVFERGECDCETA